MLSLSLPSVFTLALLAHFAVSETITILAFQDFGTPDPFKFQPNDLTAAVGDILEFHFGGPGKGVLGGNHSVALGTFDDPCVPAPGGFWSGFQAINATSKEADWVFRVEVNNTDPMVFFCALGPHCTRGMHGVVNGAGDQTLKSYTDKIDVNFDATVPAEEPGTGGRLVPNTVANILPAEDPSAAGQMRASVGIVSAVGMAAAMMML
jgi:hypothetical protein